MAIKTKEIPVEHLKLGMYVSKLDVPWASTPFPLQGFFLNKQEDLDQICQLCRHVYIDERRSGEANSNPYLKSISPNRPQMRVIEKGEEEYTTSNQQRGYVGNAGARLRRGKAIYKPTKTIQQEIRTARKIYSQLGLAIDEVQNHLNAREEVSTQAMRKAVVKVVDSVIRNPDALVWLSRIQTLDSYTYHHTMRTAIWAISFARHLGLSQDEIYQLALSALLMSCGKSKLKPELLKPKLTPEQTKAYQKHVKYSVEILQEMPDIPSVVIYTVEAHCERHNGSGYPLGLRGKRIPFLARVLGMVQYYDTLLYPQDKSRSYSSADAVSHLFKLRDSLFHGEMIEAFIQAIGVYPTGTLVELSDGRVGIILEQKREKRLRPKVGVLLDHKLEQLQKVKVLDLQQEPQDHNGNPIRIIGAIPQDAYKIDLEAVHKSLYQKLMGWF